MKHQIIKNRKQINHQKTSTVIFQLLQVNWENVVILACFEGWNLQVSSWVALSRAAMFRSQGGENTIYRLVSRTLNDLDCFGNI